MSMFIVYTFHNKKRNLIQIGFTEDLVKTQAFLESKFGVRFLLLSQEKYKSKKDALIRVKQLKNKIGK